MGKILIIRGGAVGDFILTLPAIQLLRKSLPDNELEILGYPSIAAIATATGLADRVRSIEDAKLATFFAPGAKLDEEWCAYFSSFDLVVSYLFDPDGYFGANLEAAGVKSLLRGPFRPRETKPYVHAAIQLAKPLEEIALFLDEPHLELIFPEPTESIRTTAGPLIALHPGSGSASKNWSLEAWAEVLEALRGDLPGAEFLITSGEAETETIDAFLELVDFPIHHLRDTPLAKLGAIYAETSFYLGHDSGISHLAASSGGPGLILFGPSLPEVWAPASPQMRFVRSRSGSLASLQSQDIVAEVRKSELFTA